MVITTSKALTVSPSRRARTSSASQSWLASLSMAMASSTPQSTQRVLENTCISTSGELPVRRSTSAARTKYLSE